MSVFFLHIPKTAGTSFVDLLGSWLGHESLDAYIEGRDRTTWPSLGKKAFVSGHLYLKEYKRLPWAQGRTLASMFRDPINRLASHLKYMDRYNQDEHRPTYDVWPVYIQEVVDRLKFVDFSNPHSIRNYLSDLTPWELLTFDNCQVRFLIEDPGPNRENYKASLSIDDAEEAISCLSNFDVLGVTEDFSGFAQKIANIMHKKIPTQFPQSNPSMCKRDINTRDPDIRKALSSCTRFDQRLYNEVMK